MKYELYYLDDKSNKFWTIELIDKTYKTTYGKAGSKGRETKKAFESIEKAKKAIKTQLKSKLKKGYKMGEKPDWNNKPMNNETFWQILGLFNWRKQGNDDAVIEPAVKILAQFKVAEIYKFYDILNQKLFALDTKAHAKEIGSEAYNEEDKYLSADWFLYSRCACLTNGEGYYENVLKNPAAFPKDMEFETLITVARVAYELKTGKEWDYYNAEFSYETFSNEAGWK